MFLTSGIFIIAIRNDNNDLNDFTLSRFILCVLGSFDSLAKVERQNNFLNPQV